MRRECAVNYTSIETLQIGPVMLKRSKGNNKKYVSRSKKSRSPQIEQLELRQMLAADLVINVNDASDSFEGFNSSSDPNIFVPTVTLNSSSISLREAIHLANNAGDANVTINLQPGFTYRLGRARGWSVFSQDIFFDDLDIRRSMTINGNGATVIGGGFGAFDVFSNPNASTYQLLTVNDLTIKESTNYGMNVEGKMNLTLNNVNFVSNKRLIADAANDTPGADANGAGLILNGSRSNVSQTVIINGGRFEDNYARGGRGGNADDGDNGQNAGDAYGAAIYAARAQLTIDGTNFLENRVEGGVGGFADDTDSSGGQGGDSFGGAIFAYSGTQLTVLNATFEGNSAGNATSIGGEALHDGDRAGKGGSSFGGAVHVGVGSSLDVTSTAFNENKAYASAGGFGNSNNFYGFGGTAHGGAISVAHDAVRIDLHDGTNFSSNVAKGGDGGNAFFTGGVGGLADGGAISTSAPGTWTGVNFEYNYAEGGRGASAPEGQGGKGGDAYAGAAAITNATVTINNSTFQGNSVQAGKGGDAADNEPRPGGRGGDARGGAIRVLGSSSVLTLGAGTRFVLNNVAGGNGGNAGQFNFGTHGAGGTGAGGAISADGAKLVANGEKEKTVDFAKNTASGGNAGQPVNGRDNFATPADGGDGMGGAIFVSGANDGNLGFYGAFVTALGNSAASGMGSTGVTTRTYAGTNRLNFDDPSTNIARLTLYRFGSTAGNSGSAMGGAIYSSGTLELDSSTFTNNSSLGFRGEEDGSVLNPDSGVAYDRTIFGFPVTGIGRKGGRGGDSKGGALYLTDGNVTLTSTAMIANQAFAGRGGRGGNGFGIQGAVVRNATPEQPGLVKTFEGTTLGGAGGDGGDALGGAIYADLGSKRFSTQYELRIERSLLDQNAVAAGSGGEGGNGYNELDGDYEGDVGQGGAGGRGGNGLGGGVYVVAGTLNIDTTEVMKNTSIGGDGGVGGEAGLLEMYDNSGSAPPTFYGGGMGGEGGAAAGGGIFLTSGGSSFSPNRTNIIRSTIADNAVSSGWGGGGGNGQDDPRTAYSTNDFPGGQTLFIVSSRKYITFGANAGPGGRGGAASGGGIAAGEDVVLAVDNSTIAGNRVLSGTGGYGGDGAHADHWGGNAGSGGDSQPAVGGGIALGFQSQLDLHSSTLTNNAIETGGGGLPGIPGRARSNSERIPRWAAYTVYPEFPVQVPEGAYLVNTPENGGLRITAKRASGEIVFSIFLDKDPRSKAPFGAAAALANGTVFKELGAIDNATDIRPSIIFPAYQGPVTNTLSQYVEALKNTRGAIMAGAFTTNALATVIDKLALLAGQDVGPTGTINLGGGGTGGAQSIARLAQYLDDVADKMDRVIARVVTQAASRIATRSAFLAIRGLAAIAGPGSIILSVGIEAASIVITSFVYGNGDFAKGLAIYARENLIDPEWTMHNGVPIGTSSLFAHNGLNRNVDNEEITPTPPPASRHGSLGSKGASPTPLGSNLYIFSDVRAPGLNASAEISRSIVKNGLSYLREQHGQSAAEGSTTGYSYFKEIELVQESSLNGPYTSDDFSLLSNFVSPILVGQLLSTAGNSTARTIKLTPDDPARHAGPIIEQDEVSQNGFVRKAGTRVSIGAWDGPSADQTLAPLAADYLHIGDGSQTLRIPISNLIAQATDPAEKILVLRQIKSIELLGLDGTLRTIELSEEESARLISGIDTSVLNTVLAQRINLEIVYTPPVNYVVRSMTYVLTNGDKNSNEAKISINPQPTVQVAPVAITYGIALSNSQLTGTATYQLASGPVNVAGSFVFVSDAGTVPDVGNGQTFPVVFIPNDLSEFGPVVTSVTVDVSKATPTVVVDPVTIDFGVFLTNSHITGTVTHSVNGSQVNVPGIFALDITDVRLDAGAGQSREVIFAPNDALRYANVTTNVIVNVTPLAVGISSKTVPENAGDHKLIGLLAASEFGVDQQPVHYEFVSGDNDVDNALLEIVNNELYLKNSVDYETKPTLKFRIVAKSVTNQSGTEQPLQINVLDLNEKPISLKLSNRQVVEGQRPGAEVGQLLGLDPDTGDRLKYRLIRGKGDTDNSRFAIVGDKLVTKRTLDFEKQKVHSVRVRVTDETGAFVNRVLTVRAANANEAPFATKLSKTTVRENQPVGTVVGQFSGLDHDGSRKLRYQLIDPNGETDNSLFYIQNGELKTRQVLDHESKSELTIRVKTTDAGGLSSERTFKIRVANVNEAPTAITTETNRLTEDIAPGSVVTVLSAIDQDIANTHSFRLVAGDGDTDNALFAIEGNKLNAIGPFDFETQSRLTIRVQAIDQGGLSVDRIIKLAVTNVNESPTNLTLSNNSVAELLEPGAVVGLLSATDPDINSRITFHLASGDLPNDNDDFVIVGNELRTNRILRADVKSVYVVLIRARDRLGLSTEQQFTINVTSRSQSA